MCQQIYNKNCLISSIRPVGHTPYITQISALQSFESGMHVLITATALIEMTSSPKIAGLFSLDRLSNAFGSRLGKPPVVWFFRQSRKVTQSEKTTGTKLQLQAATVRMWMQWTKVGQLFDWLDGHRGDSLNFKLVPIATTMKNACKCTLICCRTQRTISYKIANKVESTNVVTRAIFLFTCKTSGIFEI